MSKYKKILELLQGGKSLVDDAAKAIPTSVPSDVEKQMIEQLRKDPNIPQLDKTEAAKTLSPEERFELMKRRPTIQDEIMDLQKQHDSLDYNYKKLSDKIRQARGDVNIFNKNPKIDGIGEYEFLNAKDRLKALTPEFDKTRQDWIQTGNKLSELIDNRDQNYGKILELLKKQ